ncbi:MAG TPA: hypothetical protein VGM07_10905 [Stellaceae bacterium]|jgi:hypothetical protein
MTTLKPSYGTPTAITITTSSLASDANLLAGRQSSIVNNTSDLAVDSVVGGTISAPGSAPTAGTFIEVWLFGSWDGGTSFSGGASSGGDANLSLATTGTKQLLSRGALIGQTDTTARAYEIGPVSVAQAFGGTMPDHWGVFIVHDLGVTLGAAALKYTPIQYTNA